MADKIPLDFWEEGVRRLKAIKPDIFMLSEGESSKFIEHTFDGSYHWRKQTKLINIYKNPNDMSAYKKVFKDEPYYNRTLNYIENHDEASDVGVNRYEKVFGNDGVESMIFLIYSVAGIPFLWNGMEICDDSENCMFSNRYFGRKNFINWSYGMLNKGKKRMELIKKLSELYHTKEALYDGTIDFADVESESSTLLSFIREKDDKELFVCVNTGNPPVTFKANNKLKSILSKGAEQNGNIIFVEAYGYIMADILK